MNKTRFKVLVVDDQLGESGVLQDMFVLKYAQLPIDLLFESCLTGNDRFWPFKAIEKIHQHPDVCLILLDIKFGSEEDRLGLEILRRIREDAPKLPVVMLTSLEGEPSTVVTALQLGAKDYVIKDPAPSSLLNVVQRFARIQRHQWEIQGDSAPMVKLRKQIDRAAQYNNTSILILGERGSGKELVARNIAKQGSRATQAFVEVNCAAIAPTLFEAEMFGSLKGSYTGSDKDRFGFIELANNGVLFLDEVGEMPLDQQAKLLRALEQKSFRRVGASDAIESDFQLICATNADLTAMVDTGTFRGDLYDRIRAIEIHTSPLRQCRDDIPLLINHFCTMTAEREEAFVALSVIFTEQAIECMQGYQWPGNIRELRQAVEHALFHANGKPVQPDDLRPEIKNGNPVSHLNEDANCVGQAGAGHLGDHKAGTLSILLLDVIQAVFERNNGNRAATMRCLFPGMKDTYFGRMAWDLVKMNPSLLETQSPEGKRFCAFEPLRSAYLGTQKSRDKTKQRNLL